MSVAIVGHMPHLTNLVFHLCGTQDTPPFGPADAVTLKRGDPSWELEEVFHP